MENWRKLQEVPSAKEILSEGLKAYEGHGQIPGEEPQLPENIVDSPWVSKEKYVSTHYQLLREDVVAPLRNAVASYRANPMMNDDDCVSIYTNVSDIFQGVSDYTLTSQGVRHWIYLFQDWHGRASPVLP